MSDRSKKKRFRISRRGFLIGTGTAGVGLVLGLGLGRERFHRFLAGQFHKLTSEGIGAPVSDPDAWFEITPENVVRFNVIKIDMGQGIHTALTQIAADELCAHWDQLDVRRSNTAFGPQNDFTFGSFSVTTAYEPLRIAAASMRELLIGEASSKLSVPTDQLEAHLGVVRVKADHSRQLTFGEVVEGVDAWPDPPDDPVLKDTSEFTYIGKVVPRIDFEDKLRGNPVYAYDIQRPEMLYGAVARPPTIEATMVSASAGEAESMPGVAAIAIDVEAGFAGVAARTREQARRAVQELDIRWDEGRLWSQDEIDALLVTNSSACTSVSRQGDGEDALDQPLVSDYAAPFAVHAHLEPQAALVDPINNDVFVSAQGLKAAQDIVSDVLDVDPDDLTVHNTYLGGSFGRKMGTDSANEAARLAKATGRPVHVGWTREEDMRHGYVRPPQRCRLSGSVEEGRIVAWSNNIASGEILFDALPKPIELLLGADPGIWVGGLNLYHRVPNYETQVNTVKLPVHTGPWRGLGALANGFAIESFMDELAHLAGADPLQFRLDHLDYSPYNERIRTTLTTVAELADYDAPLAQGRARGIAITDYHDSIASLVAEISVEDSGEITVHRASGVADIGLAVSPDGSAAQAEGSITMALSSTLIEEMTVKDGVIEPDNFHLYPLITNHRTPEIDVRILGSDGRPRGMGECMMGPVAAAVGNAFFNLTGRRLRQIPFTAERVRAALL